MKTKILQLKSPTRATLLERVGQDWLLFDPIERKAFSLSASTYFVWEHTDRCTSLEELTLEVERHFEVDHQDAHQIVVLAVASLRKEGFVETRGALPSDLSRRDLLARGVKAALLPALWAINVRAAAASTLSTCTCADANKTKVCAHRAGANPNVACLSKAGACTCVRKNACTSPLTIVHTC